MPIFGVRNFTLNQYLGSVNYNMDKNSIFRVHKSEKGRIVEFGVSLQGIRLNIWGPQNIRLNPNPYGLFSSYHLWGGGSFHPL